jgi:hypothetical protein
MRKGGTDAAEQARDRPRHPELLAARRKRERLDAFLYEFRMSRDRSNPQILRNSRQLPQELLDVRLVTRSAAAERVRVDDDERRHAPPTSR